MQNKPQVDIAALLPPKRRIVRDAIFIALISLAGGPLLGLYVFNAPRGEMLVLSLGTGLAWGLSFAFVSAFVYTAWLILCVNRAYRRQRSAQKMDAFYRAIEGEDDV